MRADLTTEEKESALELINRLEIIDSDADGEILYYALVANESDNVEILKEAGITDEEINDASDEDTIDLSYFIWDFAEWFDGKRFLIERPDED